jgi:sulfotransferase famil protein
MTATIFLHVPKTAGTTLYHILDRQFPRKARYTIWFDGSFDDFKNLSEVHRSNLRLVRGHIGYGLHQYLPQGAQYFTFLREPLERTVSYYQYVRRSPTHYCYDQLTARKMKLLDFIDSRIDRMTDNAHVRLLCGHATGQEVPFGECTPAMLEAAKQNIKTNIALTGLTEKFDATLLLLGKMFGWRNLYYAPQNIAPNESALDRLPPTTLQALRQVNALDIELYRYAREVFDQHIQQQAATFAAELQKFQANNQRWALFYKIVWGIPQFSVRTKLRRWLRPNRHF